MSPSTGKPNWLASAGYDRCWKPQRAHMTLIHLRQYQFLIVLHLLLLSADAITLPSKTVTSRSGKGSVGGEMFSQRTREAVVKGHMEKMLRAVPNNIRHPLQESKTAQMSPRSDCLISMCCRTKCHSRIFIHGAIRLYSVYY